MFEQRAIDIDGVPITYLDAGPADGAIVVLVHGFPDTAWSWETVAQRLIDEGRRVLAPFLRGYAPSGVGPVDPGVLVADLVTLTEAVAGGAPVVLVGHDVGAVVVYGAAAHRPELFAAVVTLSVPPLPVLAELLKSPRQLQRSWYTIAFQLPGFEDLVALGDFALLRRLWRAWSPDVNPEPHLERLRHALPDRGHRAAALEWYRSSAQATRRDPAFAAQQEATKVRRPPQPWRYLHGTKDGCVGAAAIDQVEGAVAVDGAGHFLPLERPEAVVDAVLALS